MISDLPETNTIESSFLNEIPNLIERNITNEELNAGMRNKVVKNKITEMLSQTRDKQIDMEEIFDNLDSNTNEEVVDSFNTILTSSEFELTSQVKDFETFAKITVKL